jgi:RNA polymerase sigma factor (sigma-70 family)
MAAEHRPLTVPIALRTVDWASVAVRRSAVPLRSFPLAVSDVTDQISPALDAIVARFGRMLRSVARRRGIEEEDLAEVLQNLRLRLWRAHPDGKSLAALGASYIYQTAVSASLDVIRQRRAYDGRNRISLATGQNDPPAPDSGGPAAALERSEDARTLAEAVRALPETRRVPVRMHLSGYSRDEIAGHLGWSEAKTRNLLYRGLEDLRTELRRRGLGPEAMAG